ncbi:MAG: bifunctional folylpolyglutamate synthase/dihydrofolate synthase [Treponematales bacterium]
MRTERKPFASFGDVFGWLSGFINLERGQKVRSFSLDRMKALARLAGNPERRAPAVHVAGSKGKGSVTAMIAAILTEAGYRCARYMSPHVSDPRERLGLGNGFFDEAVYIEAGEKTRAAAERALECRADSASPFAALFPPGEEPTYFELLTLFFFFCAAIADCGAMVLETGLGGRLDSTNIVNPEVSVITLIELEHTDILGGTVREIAGEKAGIIKPGKPLVLGEQGGEAREVFTRTARERNAPLCYFPDAALVENIRVFPEGTAFTLTCKGPRLFDAPLSLSVPLPGEVQARNAGLAALAAKMAFPAVTADAVRRGLAQVALPGRFERVSRGPLVIIDGAHTAGSVKSAAETFARLYGSGGILLFGCAVGKDSGAMARSLLPFFSTAIITAPGTFKASDPGGTHRVFQQVSEELSGGGAAACRVILEPDTRGAIERAAALGRERRLPVLGTGSFYLAGEIRGFFLGG